MCTSINLLVMEASGDEYEESFESFSSKSPSKSPQKQHKAKSRDDGDGQDEDDEKDKVAGMNLETFMGNYKININGNSDGNGGLGEDPSMRPLEGVSPDRGEAHRAIHKKFGALGESGRTSDEKEPRITSPVDTDVEKENQRNGLGRKGDDEDDEDGSRNEADALLAKIKAGSLGTGISSLPASVERKLADKKKSLSREYERERRDLKERTESLEAMEKSEVLSATRDYLERAKAKARSERGPIDAEQLAYYTSLVSDLEKKADKQMSAAGASTGGSGKVARSKGARSGGRVSGSQNEYDQRMENLLTDLLPDRASSVIGALKKGKANTSDAVSEKREEEQKSGWSGRREYGLTQPDYNGSIAMAQKSGKSSNAVEMASAETSREDPNLSAQVAQLKREIKGRDDRLQRLTEHSMQLGNLCEKQKSEIAELRKHLNSFEMELDAKEQRANDAARLRKKAQKKAKQMEGQLKDYNAAVDEIERLTEREAALLEAVDALSGQNEDLIRKLKQSMARELELSQRTHSDEQQHASIIQDPLGETSASVRRRRGHSPQSPPRAQSDTRAVRSSRRKATKDSGRLPDVMSSKYR